MPGAFEELSGGSSSWNRVRGGKSGRKRDQRSSQRPDHEVRIRTLESFSKYNGKPWKAVRREAARLVLYGKGSPWAKLLGELPLRRAEGKPSGSPCKTVSPGWGSSQGAAVLLPPE